MAINRVNLEDVISDAKSALEAGNPERAIVLCHHIFSFYPRCLEAARMLGEAYTEQRLFTEAEQLFIFVLSADPQDVLGYVDRGFIAYEQGHLDDAILYCERALELDPSIEQLREELLRLYRERQPGARATIRISKVGLANARLRDGLYGQAIEEFNTVLRQTPNRLDVQVGLMEAYWRNRDYHRAEQIASELIQNNPFLVKANLILWHIYGVRRNQENASDYLELAHALDPLNSLAERLFEDSPSSTEALNYISMLGVPSIPEPDFEAVRATIAKQPNLVPDWARGGTETDVVLGLKSDLPSVTETDPAASSGPAMGHDLFSLLSDTEKYVAEEAGKPGDLYPDTEEDEVATPAPGEQAAQAPVGKASEDHEAFKLYEEVDTPEQAVKPTPASEPAQNESGDFDLDFSVAKEGDLSLFEEIEHRMQPEDSGELPPLAPFSFEPDITSDKVGSGKPGQGSTISADLTPFTFDEDVSPPAFMRDIPPFFANTEPVNIAPAPNFTARQDDFALPVLEPFSFDETAESAKSENPDPAEQETRTASFQFQDFYANDADSDEATQAFRFIPAEFSRGIGTDDLTPKNLNPEIFQPFEREEAPGLPIEPEPEPHPTPVPTPGIGGASEPEPEETDQSDGQSEQPAVEPPGLSETEPGADPHQPLPMFETEAATAAEPVNRNSTGADAGEEGAYTLETSAHSANPAAEVIEVYREPYAFYKRDEQGPVPDFALEQIEAAASLPAFSGLEDLDIAPTGEAAAPAGESLSSASPDTLQENPPMPIRRGQENLNDLFDWEREELPDYLQPFALDEEEFAQSADLGPESPFITDVNTPPARIRSREDTGPINIGDLPAWLVNEPTPEPSASTQNAPESAQTVTNNQPAITDRMEIGTNALPSWLNRPPSAPPPPPANSPAFDDSDFGDLAPFNLDENNDFNAPTPPSQPSGSSFNLPGFEQDADLEPFRLDDDTGGFEAPATPTPPRPLADLTGEVRRPTGEVAPPPAPTADFDLGLDLDDLKPFSFEEFDAAAPAPPSNAAAPTSEALITPPPIMPPVPPTFAPDEDFEDLLPFNLEDDGPGIVPPPLAPRTPAPQPPVNPVPFADQLRQTGPLNSGKYEAMQPFNLTDFDEMPVRPPTPPASSPAASGGQSDFDFEPFTWNDNGKGFGSADTANFNPFGNQFDSQFENQFKSLSQNDYAQPASPPQITPSENQPLRQFEWTRPQPQPSEPAATSAEKTPSIFEKMIARRKESAVQSTSPLTEPAVSHPAPTGPADITDEDLLPIEELEARAAQREAAKETQPLKQSEPSPVEQLDAAVAADTTPSTVEPVAANAPPAPAYGEAPDVQAMPVEAAPAPAPETAPTPAPVQPVQKAVQSYDPQDVTQSLNYFNQAVKTAAKDDLPEIVSKLKEITGAADANPRFHRVLGDAYKKQGQFQAALAEYSKALAGSGAKK